MPACNEAAQPVPAIEEEPMNGIIYLVGLIVIIMFILSFLGLR
jgi:predicted membrane channel-forming protein YqfA (hemolysin III family)